MVWRRVAFCGAIAALAMVPMPEASAQSYYQRHYGEVRSPTKNLGEIRPKQQWLGKLRGPQGYLTPPASTVVPPIGGGFVMHAQKQSVSADTPSSGAGDELNLPREVPDKIIACWRPPTNPGSALEVTVRMSFSRTGEVIGQPRITYVKAGRDEVLRDALRTSILTAIRSCTPLRFTPGLGKAIAGHGFAIRFIAPAAKTPASAI